MIYDWLCERKNKCLSPLLKRNRLYLENKILNEVRNLKGFVKLNFLQIYREKILTKKLLN